MLGVHAPTPKDQIPAKFTFQPHRVHLRGRTLDRIEHIEAGINKLRDQGVDRTAGMDKRLPIRALVDEIVDAPVERSVEVAIG